MNITDLTVHELKEKLDKKEITITDVLPDGMIFDKITSNFSSSNT